jgi:hypothetical protein
LPCLSAILGRSLTRESIFPAYATAFIIKPLVDGNATQNNKTGLAREGLSGIF